MGRFFLYEFPLRHLFISHSSESLTFLLQFIGLGVCFILCNCQNLTKLTGVTWELNILEDMYRTWALCQCKRKMLEHVKVNSLREDAWEFFPFCIANQSIWCQFHENLWPENGECSVYSTLCYCAALWGRAGYTLERLPLKFFKRALWKHIIFQKENNHAGYLHWYGLGNV